MKTYEFLESVQRLKQFAEDLEKQEDELRTIAEKVTAGEADGMPRGSDVSDKVGNLSAKISDIRDDIIEANLKYLEQKEEVLDVIRQLELGQYNVLFHKYILGMRMTDIAEAMHYSRQTVWRHYEKAIESVEKILQHNVT